MPKFEMYHDITNPGNPQTQDSSGLEVVKKVPWHYKSGQSPDTAKRTSDGKIEYHDITNPGNPQTKISSYSSWFKWYHDITNPGNPQTFCKYYQSCFRVPWHYKSGQSPDFMNQEIKDNWKMYHDITNPGNPQTEFPFPEPRWHLKYHDITNPGNPQTAGQRRKARKRFLYHDITNPGNPQTRFFFLWKNSRVPWHYKSGQSPDFTRTVNTVLQSYHDITNPGNPQTTAGGAWSLLGTVPWHYKSGQSPDKERNFNMMEKRKYHDITNPGNPQTRLFLQLRQGKNCTMTLQIRAIPRLWRRWFQWRITYHDITNPGNPQTDLGKSFLCQGIVPWHYKSGQSPDGNVEISSGKCLSTMTLQIRAIPRHALRAIN